MISLEYRHRIRSPYEWATNRWKKYRYRTKDQNMLWGVWMSQRPNPPKKVKKVKFYRFAPRPLDECDNLQNAFKATNDQLIELLGYKDDSPRSGIKWEFENVKSKEYRVRIEIYGGDE